MPHKPAQHYTVIGHYQVSGILFAEEVLAHCGKHAFAEAVAALGPDIECAAAILGVHIEGDTLTFPGDSLVDGDTVERQPEVFGKPYDIGDRLRDDGVVLFLRGADGHSERELVVLPLSERMRVCEALADEPDAATLVARLPELEGVL